MGSSTSASFARSVLLKEDGEFHRFLHHSLDDVLAGVDLSLELIALGPHLFGVLLEGGCFPPHCDTEFQPSPPECHQDHPQRNGQ